ncbi:MULTISPECIES: transglycosylase SLT domain-containing protein [unclassified Streptomyces]|uniref:transglycosylase SLT domain-containing protein n=1 Tax=unclassified Streptomyces TaxID=2593676 RepID=UPI001BEA0D2A|nr:MULTISPECIES: transglycosylase SLT domain-containing protein [unclassified Streptomyces]MBT2405834.1 transglycosylase SLT domain-containing protein [Streptomyces sp. ISL-21]MBT2456938.1 transglycosylase SLT domain-containing protein [Streptomyces sp. ISL-86]MBT2612999.1 transglycosylase SLT domain-containing protein [Streptomyces sp. ISL-87]
MSETSTPGHNRRLTKANKLSFAGIATLGAAALAFSLVPANAGEQTGTAVAVAPVAWTQVVDGAQTNVLAHLGTQHAIADKNAKDAAAKAAAAAAKAKAAAAKAKAEAAAKKAREAKEAASRSAARTPVFANNLDGWIKEALSIMKREGIPGTYAGIHRNIMRESSGNPRAINNWDINAQNGIPSKGLLQVIQPTFAAYHVKGTKFDLYDPVANIVAACNYAADRYGSMDNVNSAY